MTHDVVSSVPVCKLAALLTFENKGKSGLFLTSCGYYMLPLQRVFLTIVLGFSVVPFLLGVGVAYALILLPGYTDFIRGYGAVLLVFLAGLRCSDSYKKHASILFIVFSAVTALLACATLLIGDFYQSLSLQLGCFLFLLVLELRLRDSGQVEHWYFRLRLWTSLSIAISLMLILTAEL